MSFFNVLPPHASNLQLQLQIAKSTMQAALSDPIFPVFAKEGVHWVAGPRPLFKTDSLSDEVQEALASDGLQLVTLPPKLRTLYNSVLKPETPTELHATELCSFLKRKWMEHHEESVETVAFRETCMASLADLSQVLAMLKFILEDAWNGQLQQGSAPRIFG